MTTGTLKEFELRVFVGSRKADYYLTRWKPLLEGQGWSGFNWAACLFSKFWLPYRKMYGAAAVLYGIRFLNVFLEEVLLPPDMNSALAWTVRIAVAIICGVLGNQWYFRHAVKQVDQARAAGVTDTELIGALSRRGQTSVLAAILFFVGFLASTWLVFWLLGVPLT